MKKYNAPRVKESRGIQILTTIWLVPFIAMIIALWLGYQYYAKIGSMVEITFESNAGLIENQSPIKMRDVTVGIVKKISLSDDGKGVVIQARMNNEVSDYLNTNAKFWIVHPDVGSDGISGLDTIVSGSYIELYSKKEIETTHWYMGLEKPFIDDNARGTYYLLSAPQSNDVREGSSIYYRMMKIGRVERVGISPDGKHVNFTIFIEEKYTHFINNKSKFYTKSSLSIDLSKGSLDMTLSPLTQLIHGGISIYTPSNSLDKHHPIKKGTIFPLYKNLAQMRAKQLGVGGEDRVYKLSFKEPTTKLHIGAPIEFKGFQVGYITEIEDSYNEQSKEVETAIYTLLQVGAFRGTLGDDSLKDEEILPQLVKQGLKARLSSSIPVIGSQFIELVFDREEPATIVKSGEYELLPTLATAPKRDIMDEVNGVLVKLQNLPLEKLLNSFTTLIDDNKKPINSLVKNLDKTINNFNKTVNNLNRFTSNEEFNQLPQSLNSSLVELESTLREVQRLTDEYGGDSKFADQLSVTLKSVSEASNSFDKINKMLDRNANALVVGDE